MYRRSMAGMGAFSPAETELARIRAERAQVDAEIARLSSGGAPQAGGFQPALAVMAPAPSVARAAVPLLGLVGLAGLGVYLFFKRKR